jgi:hypothetical protein
MRLNRKASSAASPIPFPAASSGSSLPERAARLARAILHLSYQKMRERFRLATQK